MDVPSAEALGIWCWSGESLVPGWVVGFEGDLVGFSFGWASVFVGAAGLCGIMEDEVGELGVSVAIWEIMAMLKFEKMRSDEEYDAAMERIDEIFDAPVGSAEGEELEVLVGLVEAWEGERYPIPPPDLVDAIAFRIDQERWGFGG